MSNHKGWTAEEVATYETLFALRQQTANNGNESNNQNRDRVQAADDAVRLFVNGVQQRVLQAAHAKYNGL